MSPELVAALLGAFVGAVAGGAASFAGSVVVNRLQLRRDMRIRMYEELLPKLTRHFERRPNPRASGGVAVSTRFVNTDQMPPEFDDIMREMERASVIAGREDAKRVKELDRLLNERRRTYIVAQDHGEEGLSPEYRRDLIIQANGIGYALFELDRHLAGKLARKLV